MFEFFVVITTKDKWSIGVRLRCHWFMSIKSTSADFISKVTMTEDCSCQVNKFTDNGLNGPIRVKQWRHNVAMVSLVTVSIVTNVFRIVAMLLHGLGTYLLVSLYKEGLQAPEKVLLINLSVSEILFNFFDLLSTPLSHIIPSYHDQGIGRYYVH